MGRRGGWLVGTAVLGLTLLAWVASGGSTPLVHGPRAAPPSPPPPAPTATPTPTATSPDPLHDLAVRHSPGIDLTWLARLLPVLLVLALAAALAALAVWVWRRRWHRPSPGPEAGAATLPDIAEVLRKDAEAQLTALKEGDVRNAVVACWLRLEESMLAAGISRDRSETSSELVTRVLASLEVDGLMITALAGLYREARFSQHELGERQRRAAVAALRSIHADLAQADAFAPVDGSSA